MFFLGGRKSQIIEPKPSFLCKDKVHEKAFLKKTDFSEYFSRSCILFKSVFQVENEVMLLIEGIFSLVLELENVNNGQFQSTHWLTKAQLKGHPVRTAKYFV